MSESGSSRSTRSSAERRLPETRELVFAGLPYLAIYRMKEDRIEILRVLHGAQDWP